MSAQAKCKKNKPVLHLCYSPVCQLQSVKCVDFANCTACSKHSSCVKQISNKFVEQKVARVRSQTPYNLQGIEKKFESQVQQVVESLQDIQKKVKQFKRHEWGLKEWYRADYQSSKWLNKPSAYVYQIVNDDGSIYPQLSLFSPKRFGKEFQELKRLAKNISQRTEDHFRAYQFLAEGDAYIKRLRLEEDSSETIIKVFGFIQKAYSKLNKLGTKLGDYQMSVPEQQIRDMRYLMESLLISTLPHIQQRIQNSKEIQQSKERKESFGVAQKMIHRMDQLFNTESFGLYTLSAEELRRQIRQLNEFRGEIAFENSNYDEAIKMFTLEENQSEEIEKKLKKCYQELNKGEEYYGMLQKIIEREDSMNPQTLNEAIDYCDKVGNSKDCLKYLKSLTNIERRRNAPDQLLLSLYRRYLKHLHVVPNPNTVMMTLKEVIDLAGKTKQYVQEMEARIQFINKRIESASGKPVESHAEVVNSAEQAVQRCQRLMEQEGQTSALAPFLVKFYCLIAKFSSDLQAGIKSANRAVGISESNSIKILEPYLLKASLSAEELALDSKIQDINAAIDAAVAANHIYPTPLCYSIIAKSNYIFYLLQKSNQQALERAVEAAQNGLLLKPNDYELAELAGVCLKNASKYRQSNELYRLALKSGPASHQVYCNIAQNLEFLFRKEKNTELLEEAQEAYNKSLEINREHRLSRLGKARVLKDRGQQDQAREIFLELCQEGEYWELACMYLGDIAELRAEKEREKVEREGLLREALDWYKRAGRMEKNKRNLLRVLKKLGRVEEADRVEREDWK